MNDESKHYSRNPEIAKFQKNIYANLKGTLEKAERQGRENRKRNKTAGEHPRLL